MESTFLSLKTRDFLKAFVIAVLSPVIKVIVDTTMAGQLTFNWRGILTVAISAAGAYLLKNLFTDDTKLAQTIAKENDQKIVPMNARVLPVLLALMAFSFCGNAQSFFKPLPRLAAPKSVPTKGLAIQFKNSVTALDSTYMAIRPIVVAGAYSIPDQHLMTGAGISLQNVTYNYSTQRNYCNYSVSVVMFAGGPIAPTNPSEAVSYGAMVGALNNSINAGVCFNSAKDPVSGKFKTKPNLVLSWAINFNN